MGTVPENFDPNIAHVIDADGNIFQELAPVETAQVVVGIDTKTEELIVETVELPREWDEAATVQAIEAAQEG